MRVRVGFLGETYSSLGGGGGDDDGVLHGVVLLEGLDELGDSGALLADGDVDAVKLLGLVVAAVPPLLVEHGIESDGSLAGLTITNDQLTLTTTNGDHGVDGLETSLHGLVDGLAGKNAGGLELGTTLLLGVDGALAIDGVAESIDDTAEKLGTDGNVDNFAGTLDGLALLDKTIRTEKHDTDLAGLQVHAHALDARGEPSRGVSSISGISKSTDQGFSQRTRQAPQPGHWPCRAHGRYHHYSGTRVSVYVRYYGLSCERGGSKMRP